MPERPDWGRLKEVQKRLAEEAQRALAEGLPSFGPLDCKPKLENPWNTMKFNYRRKRSFVVQKLQRDARNLNPGSGRVVHGPRIFKF